MGRVKLHVNNSHVILKSKDLEYSMSRQLTAGDIARLEEISSRYDEACALNNRGTERAAELLREVGDELTMWFSEEWLEQLLEYAQQPLIFEVVGRRRRRRSPEQQAVLNAPWELLRDQGEFLALGADHVFAPLRRFGREPQPSGPRPGPLSILFMAAAPVDVSPRLDYESEEAQILGAAERFGLKLLVEPTGTLHELEVRARDLDKEAPLHIVHLSCHGEPDPPQLVLEDEYGRRDDVEAHVLADQLGADGGLGQGIGLLFLSACWTSAPGSGRRQTDSLAVSLTNAGIPAVLGWAAPVGDHEAATFAASLYEALARGDRALSVAVARARRKIAGSSSDPRGDWHLSRLFIGRRGGGKICQAGRNEVRDQPAEYLGRGKRRVEVASRYEFRGRRRELQRTIRALRVAQGAGVLVLGPSGVGKSSFAKRILDLESHFEAVVLIGAVSTNALIEELGRALGPEAAEWTKKWRRDPRPDMATALGELLEAGHGPLLLLIDGLEAMLDPTRGRATGDHAELLRALLFAFDRAHSKSQLLLTSTCDFSITNINTGEDLRPVLTTVELRA